MPHISGIDFFNSLRKKPLLIFTTAYSDYALTGYELDAVDYLLKATGNYATFVLKDTDILSRSTEPCGS